MAKKNKAQRNREFATLVGTLLIEQGYELTNIEKNDAAMQAALKSFQAKHGLKQTGTATTKTLDLLRDPPEPIIDESAPIPVARPSDVEDLGFVAREGRGDPTSTESLPFKDDADIPSVPPPEMPDASEVLIPENETAEEYLARYDDMQRRRADAGGVDAFGNPVTADVDVVTADVPRELTVDEQGIAAFTPDLADEPQPELVTTAEVDGVPVPMDVINDPLDEVGEENIADTLGDFFLGTIPDAADKAMDLSTYTGAFESAGEATRNLFTEDTPFKKDAREFVRNMGLRDLLPAEPTEDELQAGRMRAVVEESAQAPKTREGLSLWSENFISTITKEMEETGPLPTYDPRFPNGYGVAPVPVAPTQPARTVQDWDQQLEENQRRINELKGQ